MYVHTSPKFQLHHGEITLLTITRYLFHVQLALVCPPKNSARMSHMDGRRFQPQTRLVYAQYEGKCLLCQGGPIEEGDTIVGGYINGEGHEWDCRGT